MMTTIITGVPHARSNRVRALGVTGAKRSNAAPDVPTIAETTLPGYQAEQWYGVVAPAKTPADIITRLNTELTHVLKLPEVKTKFSSDGANAVSSAPDEFARFIRTEMEKWSKVAREASIKAE